MSVLQDASLLMHVDLINARVVNGLAIGTGALLSWDEE
jgi:hypothetical protein